MKKIFTFLFLAVLSLNLKAIPPTGCDLIITGAFDGPLSGGIPKLLEIYVVNNIPDMSLYGVSSVTNGGGTTGAPEFTFPSVAATAGDFIYLATDSASVFTYFGFYPDYVNGFMNVNGDDALELFTNGVVTDVFGDVNCDPNSTGTTCPAWEYLDGWAYRNSSATCNPVFSDLDWTFSGANATDGETSNASAVSSFPFGTFGQAGPTDTIISFSLATGTTVEALGTFNVNLKLNQVTTSNVTVDVDLLSFTNNVLTNTFPTTATFMAGTTTSSVAITWLDDAIVEANEQFELIIQNPSSGSILGADSIYTLTINDDDTPLPYYSIATLRGTDTDGQADSLNVTCKLSGTVLGVNYATGTTQNFFIHDGTAGIGVYISTAQNIFGYTINEGDSVTLTGTVGQFRGQSQMINLSELTLVGTGTLPAISTVTALNESTEGELVKLANVTVVSQASWGTNAAGGYDVEVTNGTTTFMVRIDADVNLFGTPLPGCVLDVTGIGSQFTTNTAAPFTNGYRILPRYTADIVVIDTCETIAPPTVTIADATTVDAQGEPTMLGAVLTLKGIITSPDFRENQNGTEFTFSDGTGGIWAYTSDSLITFDPIVGDSVVVSGNIGAASGVTRFYIDNVTSLGAATPFTPTTVATALNESHEAELIKINGLKLNGVWNSSGGSYNVSATANGITYDIRVDADRAELFQVPLTQALTFNLTGVGSQFDASAPRTEGYQVMPRFDADIEIVNAINSLSLADFSVNPNPASEVLNVRFEYNNNEQAQFNLMDVLGNVVSSYTVNLTNGANKNTIDVSNLTAGFYLLQIQTTQGVANTNVIVK